MELNPWEVVSQKEGLSRIKVYGGWLVKHTMMFQVGVQNPKIIGATQQMPLNGSVAIAFVPDAEHKWEIEKQEDKTNQMKIEGGNHGKN